jgi:hypothetical protein
MKGKNHGAAGARLVLVAVLIGVPLGAASGLDRSGARTFDLQRDLRTVRPQVERAPRASSFDLKKLQRRLHDRRIERPRDQRLQGLALELQHLRARADRGARRPSAAALPRSSPLSAPAAVEKPGTWAGRTRPQPRRRPGRTSASGWSLCREASPRSSDGWPKATPQPQPDCSRRSMPSWRRYEPHSVALSQTIRT